MHSAGSARLWVKALGSCFGELNGAERSWLWDQGLQLISSKGEGCREQAGLWAVSQGMRWGWRGEEADGMAVSHCEPS